MTPLMTLTGAKTITMTKISKKLASMQRKQEGRMETLRAKAPNHIPYEDCWDLKDTLASIIADHLRAFIYWEKRSPYGGIPGRIAEKWTDPEKGMREWLNILRKMLFAFDSFRLHDNLTSNPKGVDVEDCKQQPEYDGARVREGMQLFVDYFDCLWI